MPSNIITPSVVAKMAALALENELVFGGLVNRGYDKEFRKVGDTITVRVPATFTAIEFDGDLTGEWADVAEGSVQVKLDKMFVVPIKITTADLTLKLDEFHERVVVPAARAMAQKIDSYIADEAYKSVPYYSTVSGTPSVSDILSVWRKMEDNKVPRDKRVAVLCPATTAKYVALDAFLHAEKRGDTDALKEASLGRVFGFDFYCSQNIVNHSIGTSDLEGALNGAHSAGATTLAVSSLGTGTVNRGTLLTVQNVPGTYVVTETATISSNAANIKIYPPLASSGSNGATVTLTGAGNANLFFNPFGIVLAMAPVEPPIGGAEGDTAEYKGYTVQVVKDYDIDTFVNKLVLRVLCGVKVIQPELCCRLTD